MAKAMREYGDETTARKVCGSIKAKSADSKDAPPMKIKIVVDGKEHEAEAGSADHIALQARADAALAAASAKAETEKARADAAQVKIDALTKDLAEAPAKIRAESDARAKLETDARAVLGADAKFAHADGDRVVPFSTRDIHAAVLAKLEPSYKIDSAVTDPYLQARFDIAVADARKIAGGGETLRGFNPSNESRVDANGADFDYDKMVADAQKREADAWKTPAPKN